MNDVGKDGKFTAIFDVVLAPVVGELVVRFLPGHALGNPLVTAAMLLPGLAGTVQQQAGVGQLLHTLKAHLGLPALDELGLGAGDGLDQTQQSFGGGYVSESLFSVCGGHFQLVTTCHQLTAFVGKPSFELAPVFARGQVIGLLR